MTVRVAIALVSLSIAGAVLAQDADPLAGLGTAVVSGDAAAARQKITEVMEAARRQNDIPQQGLCTLLLGFSDVALDDASAARHNFEESVQKFDSAGEHVGSWMALWALAELEKNETNYAQSVAVYERAVAVLDKAALPSEKFSLQRMQSVATFFAGGPLPLASMGLPDEVVKPILLLFAEAITRDGYGSALLEAGRLKEAEGELMRARETSTLFGGLFDASFAAHFGDLRRRQWRFDEAREEYKKALRGVAMLPGFALQDDRIQLGILAKLADLEMLSGRTAEALSWNDRALALARAAQDRGRQSSILADRGHLLIRARRFDAAQAAYEAALAIASPARRAGILSDLAFLEMVRGRYGAAVTHYQQVIDLAQETHDAINEAHAWTMLAQVYDVMDLRANADIAIEHARALAAKTDFRASQLVADLMAVVQRYWEGKAAHEELYETMTKVMRSPEAESMLWSPAAAEALVHLIHDPLSLEQGTPSALPQEVTPFLSSLQSILEGATLIRTGESAKARTILQKGLELNPSSDFRAGFHALIGIAWANEGNSENATAELTRAADALDVAVDDIRVEDMLSAFLGSGRSVYYDLLVDSLARQGRSGDAFALAERARARAFLQMIGNSRIAARAGTDTQLVSEAEALRLYIADLETNAVTASAGDIDQARVRYAALQTQLKVANPEYASMTTIAPSTVDDARDQLPADTTLVSYFVTAAGVHAWIVDRVATTHVLLHATPPVMARVMCWTQQLGAPRGVRVPGRDSRCHDAASAEDVYRVLIGPLREKIGTPRLLIVPHGVLHYVPFAALRNPESGRYLVEDFTITYAPSVSSLRFLRTKETPVAGSALVFGDPARSNEPDLPYAEDEARHVADALGTTPLLGVDALESRLYTLDGAVDLVHIAAHGAYDAEHPLFSRIALAPGEGKDGNLEVHEILSEVDLSGVNLVVLAACETGLGRRSGGDDVVGLTRAFLYAGTPGVVATLWKISDATTAALMDEFYCQLVHGSPAADALRLAQLSMLHSSPEHAPAEWAAFALYGNPAGRWGPSASAASTRSPQAGQ